MIDAVTEQARTPWDEHQTSRHKSHPFKAPPSSSWPCGEESAAMKNLNETLNSASNDMESPSLVLLHNAVSSATKLYRGRSVSSSNFTLQLPQSPSDKTLLSLGSYGLVLPMVLPPSQDLCLTYTVPRIAPHGFNSHTPRGYIAESVNRKGPLSTLSASLRPSQPTAPRLQKIAAKKWLDRSLARGRPFTPAPTSTPQDSLTSNWTLAKRLPPVPSRLCLNSPSPDQHASSSDLDLPHWAQSLVRVNQSPRSSMEKLDRLMIVLDDPPESREPHEGQDEGERARGGVGALQALMLLGSEER